MPSKHFHEILEKMKEIHDSKSHDYSSEKDPLSNFKFAASIVEHFNNPIDQVFAGIIGIKLARLSELLNGKEAKNESTFDSFVDLSNYCILWASYYESKKPLNLLKDKIDDALNKPTFYDNVNKEQLEENKTPNKHPCPKCRFTTDIKYELIAHAEAMHSARYHSGYNRLEFNDIVINFLN